MLDAPVSGGPKGALAGTMTMVIGGEAADLARAMPLLEAMSAKRVHVGPSGAGHVTKLVNNLLCGANLVLLGEAMGLIEEAGLDVQTVFSGINAGSGRSGVSEVNLPNWIANGAFNSGFTMGLMRKDIRLAAQLMDELDLAPPLAKAVAGIWAASTSSLPMARISTASSICAARSVAHDASPHACRLPRAPRSIPAAGWVADRGEIVAGEGEAITVTNPANGQVLFSYPDAGARVARQATEAARAGFRAWAALMPAHRGRIMQEIGRQVRAHLEPLAKLESLAAANPSAMPASRSPRSRRCSSITAAGATSCMAR